MNIEDQRHKGTLTHYGEVYFMVSPPGAVADVIITITDRDNKHYIFQVQVLLR